MRRIAVELGVFMAVFGVLLVTGWGIMAYYDVKVLTVTSGSMQPMFDEGTRVVVIGNSPIRPNQIISFRNPELGGTTTHIYGGLMPDGTLATRGMANDEPDSFDPAPTPVDVVGRVVAYTDALTLRYWTSLPGIGVALLWLGSLVMFWVAFRIILPPRKTAQYAAEDTSPESDKELVTNPV